MSGCEQTCAKACRSAIERRLGKLACNGKAAHPTDLPAGTSFEYFHKFRNPTSYGKYRAREDLQFVVLHNGGKMDNEDSQTIRNHLLSTWATSGLSSHFFVSKKGTIYSLLNIDCTARHTAGQNINERSIGIDLPEPDCEVTAAENVAKKGQAKKKERKVPCVNAASCGGSYPKELLASLKRLLHWIGGRTGVSIGDARVFGHREVEKKRGDPSCFFPWESLGLQSSAHEARGTRKVPDRK